MKNFTFNAIGIGVGDGGRGCCRLDAWPDGRKSCRRGQNDSEHPDRRTRVSDRSLLGHTGRPRAGTGSGLPATIWFRYPKFVIGFIGASVLFSFVVLPLSGGDSNLVESTYIKPATSTRHPSFIPRSRTCTNWSRADSNNRPAWRTGSERSRKRMMRNCGSEIFHNLL